LLRRLLALAGNHIIATQFMLTADGIMRHQAR
jgi:hypothetical protein